MLLRNGKVIEFVDNITISDYISTLTSQDTDEKTDVSSDSEQSVILDNNTQTRCLRSF